MTELELDTLILNVGTIGKLTSYLPTKTFLDTLALFNIGKTIPLCIKDTITVRFVQLNTMLKCLGTLLEFVLVRTSY